MSVNDLRERDFTVTRKKSRFSLSFIDGNHKEGLEHRIHKNKTMEPPVPVGSQVLTPRLGRNKLDCLQQSGGLLPVGTAHKWCCACSYFCLVLLLKGGAITLRSRMWRAVSINERNRFVTKKSFSFLLLQHIALATDIVCSHELHTLNWSQLKIFSVITGTLCLKVKNLLCAAAVRASSIST